MANFVDTEINEGREGHRSDDVDTVFEIPDEWQVSEGTQQVELIEGMVCTAAVRDNSVADSICKAACRRHSLC